LPTLMLQRLLGYHRRKKSFVFRRKPSFLVLLNMCPFANVWVRILEPSPSSLSEKAAADFGGKSEERPFCRRSRGPRLTGGQ